MKSSMSTSSFCAGAAGAPPGGGPGGGCDGCVAIGEAGDEELALELSLDRDALRGGRRKAGLGVVGTCGRSVRGCGCGCVGGCGGCGGRCEEDVVVVVAVGE